MVEEHVANENVPKEVVGSFDASSPKKQLFRKFFDRQCYCSNPPMEAPTFCLPCGSEQGSTTRSERGIENRDVQNLEELTRVGGLQGGSLAVRGCSSIDKDVSERAAYIVYRMLSSGDQEVVRRMSANKASLVIIAKDHCFTDLPGLEYLRGQDIEGQPGRSYDDLEAQTRPDLDGAPSAIFTEENVMNPVERDPHYSTECCVVHESAHLIMMMGFSSEQNAAIAKAYDAAIADGEDSSLYMFMNKSEFWANGTQAWFDAIHRTDVNDGINSRDLIREHFPELADLMESVYGEDNDYQYNEENQVW